MRRTVVLVIAASLAIFGGLLMLVGIPSLGGGSKAGVAAAATPSQQIGMKVLLINDNSDTGVAAADWVNTLKREGVPYDEVNTNPSSLGSVALPALSSTASNGTQVANYEGVVVAVSGTSGLSPAQWTALQTFEHQFSVRQVTAYAVPSSDYGLTYLSRTFGATGATDPVPTPTLTGDGNKTFPYLSKLALDPLTFGYEGTAGASDDTLISGPNNSSLVGIYTAPDGRQTMYQTFNQNQYMVQSQLLRHGELAWLARNTYFGDQRNYMETNIDDNFLADDVWSVAGVPGEVTAHSTDFLPADAAREVPSDVATAATWSKANNFRMDMLFNGGGSVAQAENCQEATSGDGGSGGTATSPGCSSTAGVDPLLTAFQATDPATGKPYTDDFYWINHTWDHPNIDEGCATTNYIEAEINQNTTWGSTPASSGNPATGGLGLTQSSTTVLGAENPAAVVTGEHSGLANLIPGNPGQVDPPSFDDQTANTTGGTLPAGQYVYAVADQFNTAAPGATPVPAAPTPPNTTEESAASVTSPITVAAGTQTVPLSWGAVCKAADYIIYRATYTGTAPTGTTGPWTPIGVVGANTTSTTAAGDFANPTTNTNIGADPAPKMFIDTGITTSPTLPAGASPTPLTDGTAVESPYEQNPNLDAAFAGTSGGGIKYFGADASKPYPNPADGAFATGSPPASQYGAASAFSDAGATGIPRYPTNIYYNVSTNAEEIDEYNTLYLPSGDGTGACAPPRTDCFAAGTAALTSITPIITSVDQGMFQHMMGNDPRPDYFHQTNLMSSTTSGTTGDGDGLYYETMNPLLTEYSGYFVTNSATAGNNAPIVQLSMAQIGDLLNEQSAWASGQSHVTGSINGNAVTIDNTGAALSVPLTGMTDVGSAYAGTVSGWANAPAGVSTHTAITAWPAEPTTPLVLTLPGGPRPGANSGKMPGPATLPATPGSERAPIVYFAEQTAPKTVKIKHGKVTVSLKCVASRGRTAKGKICSGKFTLKVAGKTMTHKFRIKSTKIDRITIKLPKFVQTATRKSKHQKMQGKLTISTTQSHAKARISRSTLTIRS